MNQKWLGKAAIERLPTLEPFVFSAQVFHASSVSSINGNQWTLPFVSLNCLLDCLHFVRWILPFIDCPVKSRTLSRRIVAFTIHKFIFNRHRLCPVHLLLPVGYYAYCRRAVILKNLLISFCVICNLSEVQLKEHPLQCPNVVPSSWLHGARSSLIVSGELPIADAVLWVVLDSTLVAPPPQVNRGGSHSLGRDGILTAITVHYLAPLSGASSLRDWPACARDLFVSSSEWRAPASKATIFVWIWILSACFLLTLP